MMVGKEASELQEVGEASGGVHTRRAGVRVPSTSKRQIVFLTGRSFRGGKDATALAIVKGTYWGKRGGSIDVVSMIF